jgi:hypothetical protein
MNEEYRFERINENNIEDLGYLFGGIGNNQHSVEYFRNKFDTSFAGVKFVGYFAYHQVTNEPAAFYGVFPCVVQYRGVQISAAQSGDTVTHINHQKKGLFIILAQMTYELARELGIKIIFGFPNKNSQHGFYNKLNWVRNADIILFKTNISVIPIYRLARKAGLISTVYYSYMNLVSKFFRPADLNPQNSLANNDAAFLYRDAGYYHYKRYGNSRMVKLNGIIIWFKVDNSLLIGDIWYGQKNTAAEVLSTLRRLAFILGVSEILINCSEQSSLAQFFSTEIKPVYLGTAGHIALTPGFEEMKLLHTGSDADTF